MANTVIFTVIIMIFFCSCTSISDDNWVLIASVDGEDSMPLAMLNLHDIETHCDCGIGCGIAVKEKQVTLAQKILRENMHIYKCRIEIFDGKLPVGNNYKYSPQQKKAYLKKYEKWKKQIWDD